MIQVLARQLTLSPAETAAYPSLQMHNTEEFLFKFSGHAVQTLALVQVVQFALHSSLNQ